jgi:transcriptional regulator with XRE-family HTH domain
MADHFDQARKRLSRAVRVARGRAGLSQEALALQAGINRSYVGQIERGVGNPSLRVLARIADTLGMDVGDLLVQVQPKR